MELERQIKLTKATKSKDTPIESAPTSIEIPPKKKLISENSAIIQRIKEAEKRANLEKLSDEELIEREFSEEAEAIRNNVNKDYLPNDDIQSYMEQSQIPQTRNMAEMDLDNDFSANESLDDSLTRAPLPRKNDADSPTKIARKSPLDDRVDLSDLLPNAPKNATARDIMAKDFATRDSTARDSMMRDSVPRDFAPQQKRGSLGLIESRENESSKMDSWDSAQDLRVDSARDSANLAKDSQDLPRDSHDSRLDSMKDFLNESGDNHTPSIISDIARQKNSDSIVGIYTPDPHELDNEFHHTVEFVDKIDNYDIQMPKNRALYDNILGDNDIIDATEDIDELNEINASLTRAQKRLEEKLKVAKIRQKLGDIKSVTPIDSDNVRANRVAKDDELDEIFIDFSQTPKVDKIDFTQSESHESRINQSQIDSPKVDLPKTPKIDLSDLILDKDSRESTANPSNYNANLPSYTTNPNNHTANPPQTSNDSPKFSDFARHSDSPTPHTAQSGTIPTRNEILAQQNGESAEKEKDEFDENFFDLEPNNLMPPSANQSTNPQHFGANPQANQSANLGSNPITNPPANQSTNLSANPNSTSDFHLPPLDLLNPPYSQKIEIDDSEIDIKVQNLFNKLRVFKIEGDIVRTYSGPVVTTFEFRPAANVKVSRIQNLQDDLSMALKATSIRIQAPIPGKDVVGIEIPNNKIQTIYLREIFESEEFRNSNANLPIALGKDVIGNPVIEDLATLPHLLIAGTTGSGKSVGINAMILSLLYKHTPKELRFIMIDPKFLEFGLYKDIPHLLTPIITDPKKAIIALSKAVEEMNRRYELMDKAKVKTIVGFNELAKKNGEEKLPYIVIIIDEFADLMIMGGREAEQFLISLAGKARASGIHLIIATQRPTVNVVTGLIKGNLPSKISYRVGSKIDSKVILDETGAEALLGKGDMLFSKTNNIVRLHAPYNDEREIERIVDFLKSQQEVQYDEFFSLETKEPTAPPPTQLNGKGDLKERAKEIILQSGKTSISYLQRQLGVGYNKSADIIEALEKEGFLSPPNYKGVREIIGS